MASQTSLELSARMLIEIRKLSVCSYSQGPDYAAFCLLRNQMTIFSQKQ
jgi:hypothetical protein